MRASFHNSSNKVFNEMLNISSGCWHRLGSIDLGKEDCLYLNVHVPDIGNSNKLLPVMVYIPGGAYTSWDISQNKFGPGHLLDRDVILVTMEYRLHILGFLTLGADGMSGNQERNSIGLMLLDYLEQNYNI